MLCKVYTNFMQGLYELGGEITQVLYKILKFIQNYAETRL